MDNKDFCSYYKNAKPIIKWTETNCKNKGYKWRESEESLINSLDESE